MTDRHEAAEVRQEARDVSGKAALWAGVIVVVVGVVSVWVMSRILDAGERGLGGNTAVHMTPARLNASPIEQTLIEDTARGQHLQEQARRRLKEWDWVDPGKVARIPLKDAARWLVEDAKQGRLSWPERQESAAEGHIDPAEVLGVAGSDAEDENTDEAGAKEKKAAPGVEPTPPREPGRR